jgi:ribosomal protein L37AE/L43A
MKTQPSDHNQKIRPDLVTLYECPRCHQHSLVKHGDSIYVCLNCRFRRDVSQQQQSDDASAGVFGILLAILVTAALLALFP